LTLKFEDKIVSLEMISNGPYPASISFLIWGPIKKVIKPVKKEEIIKSKPV
jgi:hypothetical protein